MQSDCQNPAISEVSDEDEVGSYLSDLNLDLDLRIFEVDFGIDWTFPKYRLAEELEAVKVKTPEWSRHWCCSYGFIFRSLSRIPMW